MRVRSMPGVNRSGMVPAPMRFSVAPFPPASPGVSILYPVISALKRILSYDTAPKQAKDVIWCPAEESQLFPLQRGVRLG